MRKDIEQAIVFRKSGMSYSEIMARMAVPKSTLSDWFRSQKWSNDIAIENVKKARNGATIRMMVLNTVHGGRLRKIYEEAGRDALIDYDELKYHPLFISGIMAYWAHGDKTSKSRISMSSSDPRMTKIFKSFLQDICGIKNLKAHLLLKRELEEQICKTYWIEKTGLEYKDFSRTTYFKSNGSNRLPKIGQRFGICNIGLSSSYLKNKILRWIELMAEEIGGEKYLNGMRV